MSESVRRVRPPGARPRFFAGWLLWALLLHAGGARAACLDLEDSSLAPLQAMARVQPAKTVKVVEAMLDVERSLPRSNPHRMAGLYAVLADANEALELDRAAHAAASEGLKYATGARENVRIDLLSALAGNVYDVDELKNATSMIETARNSVSAGSLPGVCLQITLGMLQYRQDRDDLAMQSLTAAYRVAAQNGWHPQRVLAAEALSHVLRNAGEMDQALSLNQEVIDWSDAHHQSIDLSVALFNRGEILRGAGRFEPAIAEFEASRRISKEIDDRQGVAFADLRTCQARIGLKQWAVARPFCRDALNVFSATQSRDVEKESLASLARIDLAQGYAARALPVLDDLLRDNGDDMPPRRAAALFEQRARTLAAMGRYQEAFVDLSEYAQRNLRQADAERISQSAALRARFETDREVDRNLRLTNELALERERVSRRTEQLHWTGVIVLISIAAIVMLIYILIASYRHRRQLVDLAGRDGLTGLPNRRSSVEAATRALVEAAQSQRSLTVGLIDLDHFKSINDRYGHAVGDRVLKEFARIGREMLRSGDFLGRWGGEEFIVVLPELTLDVALLSIERLRAAALQINLPDDAEPTRVSFSAGLAANEQGVTSLDGILARADVALYEAKSQGRDLVRVSRESLTVVTTSVRSPLPRASRP